MKENSIHPPNNHEINELCQIINTNLGFKYDQQKKYLIVSRLDKRLMQLGFSNYSQYLEYLQTEPQEHSNLFALLTTNVTSFFREAIHFRFIKEVLLPQYCEINKTNRIIRAWSAGCSSGEEAYSLAIALREYLGADWDIMVLASDISTNRLQIGSEGGPYTKEQVAIIPQHLLGKYFSIKKIGDRTVYHVKPHLRQMVAFRLMNLLDHDTLPGNIRLNIIFCRNVFIYMTSEAKSKILSGFYTRLLSDGHLFLGLSESLNSNHPYWNSIGKSIYQKKLR
jgi:chemotaxis protein methyltransferase CheR